MSYDFIIYTRRERIPSADALAAAVQRASPPLTVTGRVPDPGRSGFVPVTGPQGETGFEAYYGEIMAADAADYEQQLAAGRAAGEAIEPADLEHLEILRSCDLSITFSAKRPDEIEAAGRVAHALATMAGGWLCDPQRDATIRLPWPPEPAR